MTGKLGFGLMRLPKLENGEIDVEQVKVMVDKFLEAGMTYFDTAYVYDDGKSEEAARKAGFTNIYNCKDMPDCVRTAAGIARPGEKVLLSPACASWDMYANFEQRGRHFKQCINEMLK